MRLNNLEMAQSLLEAGCNINLADRLHHAPIHEAIRQGTTVHVLSQVLLCHWENGILPVKKCVPHCIFFFYNTCIYSILYYVDGCNKTPNFLGLSFVLIIINFIFFFVLFGLVIINMCKIKL